MAFIIAAIPLLAAAMGCGSAGQIEEYRVPKPHVIEQMVRKHVGDPPARPALPMPPAPSSPRETVPGTMLVAIAPHEGMAWYFRVVAPSAAAQGFSPQMREFLKSVRFSDKGDAEWDLPAGWRAEGPRDMRFATLYAPNQAGAPREFEIAITRLPIMGEWEEYLLLNINRWRGQMGVQPIGAAEVEQQFDEIPIAGGRFKLALWLQIDGVTAADGAPPSRTGGPIGPVRPPLAPPPTAPGPGLAYQIPAGWEQGQLRPTMKGIFVVSEGEQRVEITIYDFPSTNRWVPNVNRWRGQIGLEEADAEAIAAATEQITLADGTKGDYAVLEGTSPESPQTILAVMAVKGPRAWFVKLQGDTALAKREQLNFEGFVRSLKIGE